MTSIPLYIVSNRLPVTARLDESGTISFTQSIGGLATGLSSMSINQKVSWIGWCGLETERMSSQGLEFVESTLQSQYGAHHVALNRDQVNLYYEGFSNKTLWPLFHYFPSMTEYRSATWQSYQEVNRIFNDVIRNVAKDGDIFWIQDYQLLLLPQLIKDHFPNSKVGLFLHITFPSYELFKLLPWRKEILTGMLGSDLIGFHTFDYARHFLSSVRRILGYEHHIGTITTEQGNTQVDVFPMGIDVERFSKLMQEQTIVSNYHTLAKEFENRKIILSLDRLDYTKGIPQKLLAYQKVLKEHPELNGKTTLILIVAPSRVNIAEYTALKHEIQELVGSINGQFGSIVWEPIRYFFKTFPQEELVSLYMASDIFLVTPLRDGMNLTAKEYLVCRKDVGGTLILSENAGAAFELVEATTVNPNDIDDIAKKLYQSILQPALKPGSLGMNRMLDRISTYSLSAWIDDFLQTLYRGPTELSSRCQPLDQLAFQKLRKEYEEASTRLIFLDYDGTLVPFVKNPDDAVPSPQVLEVLSELGSNPQNQVVIISGRDRDFLERHLGHLNVGLAAGHGAWIRLAGQEWRSQIPERPSWIEVVRPILEKFSFRTPGSFVEYKEFSLAWHYRQVEPELAAIRLYELKEALVEYTNSHQATIMEGYKVLEVKPIEANKGNIGFWLTLEDWDFYLAVGDDLTDEDLFRALPAAAFTIKVGPLPSMARYRLNHCNHVLQFLRSIMNDA